MRGTRYQTFSQFRSLIEKISN